MAETTTMLLIFIVLTWFITSPRSAAFWQVVKD